MNKKIVRSQLIAILLILLEFYLSGCRSPMVFHKTTYNEFGFPFMVEESDQQANIYLPPMFYNKSNIESLCLWYYRKKLKQPNNFSLHVFTDETRLDTYLEDQRKFSTKPDVEWKYWKREKVAFPSERRALFDAECHCSPAENSIGIHPAGISSGINLVCAYAPDLTKPDAHKTLVLRGTSWTEGKYDLQTWQVNRGKLAITVETYKLYNTEPSGFYSTFSCKGKDASRSAKIIFSLQQGQLIPSLADHVEFVSDEVVYIYLGWIYALSIDAGQTWQIWDAERELPDWKCCNPELIQKIKIKPDGSGVMILKPQTPLTLYTKDYGQHWAKQ